MKASVFIATSIDGFIADQNGNLDWLDVANKQVPEGEDCGFSAFMSSVDGLVMGRKTFEKVLSFGQWPYGETKVIVLSHHEVSIPQHLKNTVSFSNESPKLLYQRLADDGLHHLYIDGGLTIQSFLRDDLIDEMIITKIPVLLGRGISLFGNLGRGLILEHIKTWSYDFGFIQSHYRIV
jgi:dihydrofolate reductase